MTTKATSEEDKADKKTKQILGIRIISSLVSQSISDPSKILSGLKQILFFYRLLPDEWKKKAFWVFEKLWNRDRVVISTNPEQPGKVYDIVFEDIKLNKLYGFLPSTDQAIMLQGKAMLNLINKSLHSDSDEIKKQVRERYGKRGLNIVDMLTTKDIDYALDELEEPLDEKRCVEKFNEWAYKYDSISILVSPEGLADVKKIKEDIIELSKNTPRKYVLVNLSGKMEDCTKLLEIINDLKEKKELNYNEAKEDISTSGFCKSLRIKIDFK